jgi:hypothetical protein
MQAFVSVGVGQVVNFLGRTRTLDYVTESLSAASELQFVSLAEALELTLLFADREPEKFERAAARWHLRFAQEVPHVDIRESPGGARPSRGDPG